MASSQCVKSEELVVSQHLSCEENSSVEEIIKQAECFYVSEDIEHKSLAIVAENECMDKNVLLGLGVNANVIGLGIQANDGLGPPKQKLALKSRITIVVGALKNQTKGNLNVLSTKKWAGHIVKNYPNPLNSVGAFGQSALSNKGVKAAVVYSGKNRAGVECGWLLAWADTKALGNRIYAECGPKNKFCNIDWGRIERRLNTSGAVAKVHDPKTGTSVYATNVGHKDKDVVGAAFSG